MCSATKLASELEEYTNATFVQSSLLDGPFQIFRDATIFPVNFKSDEGEDNKFFGNIWKNIG